MAVDLTTQQAAILRYFEKRAETSQSPPTLRELCAHFGWASSATARDHLRALVRKGALAKEPRRARGHRPAMSAPRSRAVPILGQISAGRPLLAEEHRDGEVAVPLAWAKGAFALRVVGDSMVGAGILEGDLVIARNGRETRPGDIVVARMGDEATVKRLSRDGRKIRLVAENPRYPPIDAVEGTEIVGIVVGLLREIGAGRSRARGLGR